MARRKIAIRISLDWFYTGSAQLCYQLARCFAASSDHAHPLAASPDIPDAPLAHHVSRVPL